MITTKFGLTRPIRRVEEPRLLKGAEAIEVDYDTLVSRVNRKDFLTNLAT
jgi:hypothetical protein